MQSEDFDKKIQDAAERHHPAYDEKAWMKMEQLLDEHMPVEKERKRRFLLILFFFLLLGGGAFIWFGTGYFSNGSKSISQANNNGSGHTISKKKIPADFLKETMTSTIRLPLITTTRKN